MRPRPSTGEAQAQTVGSGSAARTIIPLAAPDYQVFEVTNRLIPAGTDWFSNGLVLGSVTLPAGAGALADLWFEVSAPLTGRDQLVLADATPGDVWNTAGWSVYLGYSPGGSPELETYTSLIETGNGDNHLGNFNLRELRHPPHGFRQRAERFFAIGTNGPTHADITIVRARAAFLVI
jgi:hypothetical protein